MAGFRFSPRPNRANEIHWRDWNDDTFDLAMRDDKPILLDISGVWCHWCHVMDETSYSDPEVIQLINERFVAVRVETDQRPDVNRRYNMGGWPTTAFLTPDGELLTGGTYIPPQQMRGYLAQVSDAYKNNKPDILRRISQVNAKRANSQDSVASSGALSTQIVENVLQTVLDNFDALYGGFGDEPKFPHTEALELALERYFKTGDDRGHHGESSLSVVTITLTKMANGGMYDQEAGGFFRYSTTRDWSIPHFEKMLEDHSKLLALYAHAYQVTRRDLFLKTVQTMLGYLQSTLSDQARGGFYGSQDADEEYYALSLAERDKRTAPFVDKTLYTDWNAMMVSAYLACAPSPIGEKVGVRVQEFALKTLDRIWRETLAPPARAGVYRDGVGILHYQREAEPPQLLNQLTDLAHTSLALLDAYCSTGEPTHLQHAQTLADIAMAQLYDAELGAFFSEPRSPDAFGMLRLPDKPINENAALARALVRLYRLTEVEKYRDAAEKTLSYFASDYERYSFTASDYARAVDEFLNEPLHVRIVGTMSDARTRELHTTALGHYSPAKLVQVFDPTRDAARLQALGYPMDAAPQAYICVGTMCLPPVGDVQSMQTAFEKLKTPLPHPPHANGREGVE